LFHENIVAIGVFKFNLIFINIFLFLFLYQNLIRYNPKKREKLVEFTLGKENCKSFSISLSRNEEISPLKKNICHHMSNLKY
jgi:hypothetical protein